jgi:diguanylate cyclase (GGDEF)-like protein
VRAIACAGEVTVMTTSRGGSELLGLCLSPGGALALASAWARSTAEQTRLAHELLVLRRREEEAARISEATEYVAASRSLREALGVIGAFLPAMFSLAPPELLVQRAARRDGEDDHSDEGGPAAGGPLEDTREGVVTGDGLRAIEARECWALATAQRFVSEPHDVRCRHDGEEHVARVCVPLHDGARTVAVLSATLPNDGEERRSRIAAISDLARQLSGVLANLRLRTTLEEQATHDPLTGAVNRRRLDAELKLTVHRHEKTGMAFGVLAIDVDHFKRINDGHGHERGDRVLAGLGALLRRRLRQSDVLARIGGEEFIVLLRGVDRPTTAALAESVRAAIEEAHLAGEDVDCTCSIGAVHVERLTGEVDALLREADRALYAAKERGRNRVVLAPRPHGGDIGPTPALLVDG